MAKYLRVTRQRNDGVKMKGAIVYHSAFVLSLVAIMAIYASIFSIGLSNNVGSTFATYGANTSVTFCASLPVNVTKAEILQFINDTNYKNPGCAFLALRLYGQNTLNKYNITVNITKLESHPYDNKIPYSKPMVLASGTITNKSRVMQIIRNMHISLNSTATAAYGSNGIRFSSPVIKHNYLWGGYLVYNSTNNIQDAVGTWVVQSAGSKKNTNSSQWVGIGGWFNGALGQVGTTSNYSAAGTAYYNAFYEYDPNNVSAKSFCPFYNSGCFPIHSGDEMIGQVRLMPGTNSDWNFTLIDFTTGQVEYAVLSLTGYSAPAETSAEWMDEAGCYGPSGSNCYILNLTNFGTAYYGPFYSAGYNYAGINSAHSQDIGNWANIDDIILYNCSYAAQIAVPSSLASDQQSFTIARTSNSAVC